ncbi:MAG: phosphoribosylglycinamide formyltransferase [Bacteroidia bacterium]
MQMQNSLIKIAVFASGKGSNAEKLIDYFNNHSIIRVSLVISNKADSPVLKMAKLKGVTGLYFNKQELENGTVENYLISQKIDYIVLAGFLLKIPEKLIHRYPNKIINIHPSLLPKYGGKGMYGIHVHRAVIQNHEKESGISIHLVNEEYDKGKILFQAKCKIEMDDTPETLANKIQALEHRFFAPCVEKYILNNG